LNDDARGSSARLLHRVGAACTRRDACTCATRDSDTRASVPGDDAVFIHHRSEPAVANRAAATRTTDATQPCDTRRAVRHASRAWPCAAVPEALL